jgi:hypothetical protein
MGDVRALRDCTLAFDHFISDQLVCVDDLDHRLPSQCLFDAAHAGGECYEAGAGRRA